MFPGESTEGSLVYVPRAGFEVEGSQVETQVGIKSMRKWDSMLETFKLTKFPKTSMWLRL